MKKTSIQPLSQEQFEDHLKNEHRLSPFSTYLREITFGGSDGIVTTFAVVAGFTGATGGQANAALPLMTVLLFGIANLFADGASMSLGNFLSTRADKDVYRKSAAKERYEIRNQSKFEEAETIRILENKGYSKEDAQTMANLYSKNEDYWVEFMMNQELTLPNAEQEHEVYSSIATFIAFIGFGIVPLLPYIFFNKNDQLFLLACLFTISALLVLGVLRWKAAKITFFRAIGEVLILSGSAAMIAYFVGTLFKI